ncbi:MAG: phosphatidylglycerol lysyltransferase domain-containing protein [Candidatus Cloacimonetes bacterium]|nr:phosphatidylglycerol lysyltransferase domain-containing protein [Candidatus Cloacimonadota bacterium]MDY0299681.1 phosphatidylglycerol lysyltransferase domain-containing protein [Candidatus Cloacimonadaceae bacterium]MCB5279219.1 phosphatidylglycerol lysyltransferase domain-containing protein [Candidatus Cloacimonadota bacterium]MCK9332327.1 phosphatidylglycerol lysyltransferase domain-containing protein [Candidatus Cloacimonadota bacterium]MDD2210554.1 phosphatidylglycerol lysyltransferase 
MSDSIKMSGLKDLEVTDTLMLREYLSRWPREHCDYTITNLIAWGKIYSNKYLIYKERLVIFNPKYQYILFPIGEYLEPKELAELVALFRKYYPESNLILYPHDYAELKPNIYDYFDVYEDRDWADYIYSTESMVQLRGKKLAKKKNLISQFMRAYPEYKVMKISNDRLPYIMKFTHKWRRERSAEGIYLMSEFKAIENTIDNWDKLPVEGLIICLRQKIVAYSIFSQQTPDMVTVHFEKFDPDKKGSAQVITWETARYLEGRYKWINREQDVGLDGLKQAKMSYVPDRFSLFFASKLKADTQRPLMPEN